MISHCKKFIHIHIPRCAGSSIDNSLGQYSITKTSRDSLYEMFSERHIKAVCVENYKNYFKFAIVRNPWDRMVSIFHWGKQIPKNKIAQWSERNFEPWLNGGAWKKAVRSEKNEVLIPTHGELMLDWVTDNDGKIAVDYIGRQENMDEAWKVISSAIGIEYQKLPREHGTKRYGNYRSYYNNNSRKIVEDYFEKDIAFFDYKF